MKIIDSQKCCFSDVDTTLIHWGLSKYPEERYKRVKITYNKETFEVVPNQKNINLLHKLHKMGHTIIIWSQTGGDYAAVVAKALGLSKIVTLCTTKPKYIIDDLPPEKWIGTNIYRNIDDKDSD